MANAMLYAARSILYSFMLDVVPTDRSAQMRQLKV